MILIRGNDMENSMNMSKPSEKMNSVLQTLRTTSLMLIVVIASLAAAETVGAESRELLFHRSARDAALQS